MIINNHIFKFKYIYLLNELNAMKPKIQKHWYGGLWWRGIWLCMTLLPYSLFTYEENCKKLLILFTKSEIGRWRRI